jgi:hypothetical protein
VLAERPCRVIIESLPGEDGGRPRRTVVRSGQQVPA